MDEEKMEEEAGEDFEESKRDIIRQYLEIFQRYMLITWIVLGVIFFVLLLTGVISRELFDKGFGFLAWFGYVGVILIAIYLRIDSDRREKGK